METPRNRDDQLAEDLRALRPTPHPEFAAELDQRAAAGFPRRSRLPRFSLGRLRAIPARRLLLPAGGLAVIVIAIAGVLVTANENEREPTGGDVLGFLNAEAPSEDAPEEVEWAAGEPLPEPGRDVERSAEIILGADPADVAEDSADVFDVVHAHDGIVMSSSTQEGEAGTAGAQFELRIPSANLSDALAALSEIDEVRSRREATADITAPTVNVGELLRDSKARIDSLLGQLEGAEAESEREAVEAELRQERRHRARLRAKLQDLQRRANFSLVLVQIETGTTAEEASSDGAWGVDDALRDAGQILAIAAAVAVVALAVLGPVVLIGLLLWFAHRAWVRRQRRRVLS